MLLDPGGGGGGVARPVAAEAGGDGDGAVVLGRVLDELLGQGRRRSGHGAEEAQAGGGSTDISLARLKLRGEGGAGEGSEDNLGLHGGWLCGYVEFGVEDLELEPLGNDGRTIGVLYELGVGEKRFHGVRKDGSFL